MHSFGNIPETKELSLEHHFLQTGCLAHVPTRMEATKSVLERFSHVVGSLTRARSSRGASEPNTRTEAQGGDHRPPLTDEQLEVIDSIRQGDIVAADNVPILGYDGVRFHPIPDGAVLITQTCDAIRPEKPTVAVAPIARLDGFGCPSEDVVTRMHSAGSEVWAIVDTSCDLAAAPGGSRRPRS